LLILSSLFLHFSRFRTNERNRVADQIRMKYGRFRFFPLNLFQFQFISHLGILKDTNTDYARMN